MSRAQAGGHFIRSGFSALFLGFVMSVGMVMHYVVGSRWDNGHVFMQNITLWWACPWTLSTAVVLGGALCMIVIGTVHTSLGRYAAVADVGAATTTARRICLLSLVAIFLTGYVGYFAVDTVWPSFYYTPISTGKNVWLFMQLACIVLFALGTGLAFTDIRRASYAVGTAAAAAA